MTDTKLDASATLPRQVYMFCLPDHNPLFNLSINRVLKPQIDRDNTFYVRITLEDGNQA